MKILIPWINMLILTPLWPMLLFHTPWKQQKNLSSSWLDFLQNPKFHSKLTHSLPILPFYTARLKYKNPNVFRGIKCQIGQTWINPLFEIIMQCNSETNSGVIPKIYPQTYLTLRSCYCIYVHLFFFKRNNVSKIF